MLLLKASLQRSRMSLKYLTVSSEIWHNYCAIFGFGSRVIIIGIDVILVSAISLQSNLKNDMHDVLESLWQDETCS